MSDPLQGAYGPGTPQLAASPLSGSPNMITLLPASTGPTPSPNQHQRTQSVIVPMHSPSGSLLSAGFDLQALMQQQASSSQAATRIHSQSIGMAGILATPAAAATTNLTSPTTDVRNTTHKQRGWVTNLNHEMQLYPSLFVCTHSSLSLPLSSVASSSMLTLSRVMVTMCSLRLVVVLFQPYIVVS